MSHIAASERMQGDPEPIARLVVLFLGAEEPGRRRDRLDLAAEHRELQNVLGHGRLVSTLAAVPDDIVHFVRSSSPTVVHFSCHGDGHCLEMRDGHRPTSESLCEFFKDRGVELVVFNSCFSSPIAQHLVKEGVVRSVIGTTRPLGDTAAQTFSRNFYRTLCQGHTIRDALKDGKNAVGLERLDDVFQHEGDVDWSFEVGKGPSAVPAWAWALVFAALVGVPAAHYWRTTSVAEPPMAILTIRSPAGGSVRELEEVDFESSYKDLKHYIVVVPAQSPARWIVDGPIHVGDNGRGSGHARFGTRELGLGERFSLSVIATKESLAHGQQQAIAAERESPPVHVLRDQ